MSELFPGKIMLREIREQSEAIARFLEIEQPRVWSLAQSLERKPRFIFMAARGTSDHAALYGKYLFETMTGIPTGLASPSIASVYHAKVDVEGALFIGISQSGEAADVISVMEQANESGATTLAITNVGDSPLAQSARHTIELHVNPEIAVAATKTFTGTLAALLLLAAAIADDQSLLAEINRIPMLIDDVLQGEDEIRRKVERFRYLEECVVLGRGYNLGTAYELALKLRETCYLRAQPYASPDFVHGPIAIVEEGYPVIAFANNGPALPSVIEVIEKSRDLGAETVVFGNAREALDIADVAFPVNCDVNVPEVISPIPSIVAGQIFSQALSVIKGIDPDHPRGLRKVTITH